MNAAVGRGKTSTEARDARESTRPCMATSSPTAGCLSRISGSRGARARSADGRGRPDGAPAAGAQPRQVAVYSMPGPGSARPGSALAQRPSSPDSRATSAKWSMAMPRSTRCRSAMRSSLNHRAALAVALGALQIEVPVAAAAHHAPRLLVGRRRRHADGLERAGVAARALVAQRHAELLREEELVRREPARAFFPLADTLRAVVSRVADGDHGRHHFIAVHAAEAGREGAARERPAEPARAEAQSRGVEDDLLEQAAVVLEVAGPSAHSADQKAGRALDEAVGAETLAARSRRPTRRR